MKVSAKTEYACTALLELARSYGSGDPVRIRSIADEHGIPSRFLVQILLQLKGAGFVNSTRGAAGGYQLAKAPSEITLGEVLSIIEGPENLETILKSKSPVDRVLKQAWREVALQQQELLAGVSFADLASRVQGEAEQMYYI